MHAIVVGDGPELPLRWAEVPDPVVGDGEALVDIHATSVNRADLAQRSGSYPPPPGAPPYLGLEMSGVITELPAGGGGGGGHGGRPLAVGQRVCAILGGGGYAEQVAVDVRHLMPLPESLTTLEGGAVAEAFLTAYVNLFVEAGLRRGERLLIHGGASGVGTAAIQLAVHEGITVCVTARSARKLDACRSLGASVAVNHMESDWPAAVTAATEGGVDVVLDCVGGSYLERNVAVLRPRGRLVCIGLIGGSSGELPVGELMRRRLRLIGSVLRSRSADEKAEIVAGFEQRFGTALAARDVAPIIHAQLPIQRVEEAHRLVERFDNVGNVVLAVR